MPDTKVPPGLNIQIVEAGGYTMPRTADGLIYTPETIPYKTFFQMEDDAQVKAVLTVIKAPILNVNWKIASKDSAIAKFVQETLEPVWGELIFSLLNAINFGFQAFEEVWKEEKGAWKYKTFVDVHPDTITLRTDSNFDFDGFQQFSTKGIVNVPKEKALIFTIDKRFRNWYGRSRLRSAYFYWFIDKHTYDFENIYLERYAQPIPLGRAPTGRTPTSATASEDNISLLLSKLTQMKNSGAIAISSDTDPKTKLPLWSVEFLEAMRRGGDFIARHRQLDVMKSRAIFAPDLVFAAPTGGASYALAKEHADIFIGAEEAILNEVKTFVDYQVIPDLVSYNFGQNAARVSWEFETISRAVKDNLTRIVMLMVKDDKIELDQEWLESSVGMKFNKAFVKPIPPSSRKEEYIPVLKTDKEKERRMRY